MEQTDHISLQSEARAKDSLQKGLPILREGLILDTTMLPEGFSRVPCQPSAEGIAGFIAGFGWHLVALHLFGLDSPPR